MSEAPSAGDELDRANAAFWLGAAQPKDWQHVPPLQPEDLGRIDGLSDDEWREYLTAVRS